MDEKMYNEGIYQAYNKNKTMQYRESPGWARQKQGGGHVRCDTVGEGDGDLMGDQEESGLI